MRGQVRAPATACAAQVTRCPVQGAGERYTNDRAKAWYTRARRAVPGQLAQTSNAMTLSPVESARATKA
eukprot:2733975-Lingulodinium_polyedra.AAC.1